MQLCLVSSDAGFWVLSHHVSYSTTLKQPRCEEAQDMWRGPKEVLWSTKPGLIWLTETSSTRYVNGDTFRRFWTPAVESPQISTFLSWGSRHYRAKTSHSHCHLLELLTYKIGEHIKIVVPRQKLLGSCYAAIVTRTHTQTQNTSSCFMKFSNSWYMYIPNLAMPRETCEEVQSSDRTAFSLNPVKKLWGCFSETTWHIYHEEN